MATINFLVTVFVSFIQSDGHLFVFHRYRVLQFILYICTSQLSCIRDRYVVSDCLFVCFSIGFYLDSDLFY